MKTGNSLNKLVGGIVGIIVLFLGVFGVSFFGDGGDYIRVASFNGQIFGDAKLQSVGVDYYVDLISGYDLFFLLEIRDVDGSSFDAVCEGLVGYECLISERSGRSVSKEAVGVFVRSGINAGELVSVGSEGSFERVPVYLEVGGVSYFVVHLSPDDVYGEMEALETLVNNRAPKGVPPAQVASDESDKVGKMEALEEIVDRSEGKVVVIGDLNADCDYYSGNDYFARGWDWVIGDDEDTTSGISDCAYDRIIVSEGVEVFDSGVVKIETGVSDHNLVFVELGA